MTHLGRGIFAARTTPLDGVPERSADEKFRLEDAIREVSLNEVAARSSLYLFVGLRGTMRLNF